MSLAAGQTICSGEYMILELIGEGSFARVWKAEEPKVSGYWDAIHPHMTAIWGSICCGSHSFHP